MKIKDGFVLEKVGESYMAVAVNRRTNDFSGLIRLNETGAFLWKAASEGSVTEEELADALLAACEGEKPPFEAVKADVCAFISELRGKGIIEE